MVSLSKQQRLTLFLIGLILAPLILTGLGVAETFLASFFVTQGNIHFNATDGPEVITTKDYNLQSGQPFTQRSFNLSTETNGWINISTSTSTDTSTMVVQVDEINGTFTNTSSITAPNGEITLNPSDKNESHVGGTFSDYEFRTDMAPDDGVVDFRYTASTTANITIRGDFTDGTQYGAIDVSTEKAHDVAVADANGNLVFNEMPAESHDIVIQELGDLTIREENQPHSKVTTATAELLFYETTDDNPTITNRSTTDGVINLTGLPVDEQFAVSVEAPGYYNRTILIQDLGTQKTAFLLNSSNPASLVTFTIEDPTGQFTTRDASIEVQRAINKSHYDSGGFTWLTIAGDRTGAANELSVDLEDEVRYRLRVDDNAGDVRFVGSYTVVGATTVTLRPKTPSINVTDVEEYTYNVTQTNTSGTETIEFEYFDAQNETTDLVLNITEQGNRSNVLVTEQTVSGPLGYTKITVTLTDAEAEKNWNVTWTATRNSNTIGDTTITGQLVEQQLNDLPTWIQEAVAAITLILIGSIFSVVNVEVGAVVTSLVGGGFIVLGFLPVAAAGAVAVAAFIAVLWKAAGGRFT